MAFQKHCTTSLCMKYFISYLVLIKFFYYFSSYFINLYNKTTTWDDPRARHRHLHGSGSGTGVNASSEYIPLQVNREKFMFSLLLTFQNNDKGFKNFKSVRVVVLSS